MTGISRIEEALEDRGWTRAELARRLGTTPSAVTHWLCGRRVPSLESALRLRDIIGVPVTAWREVA
jgi:transcriptional regulator with XRE-family HTH domain